MSDRTDSTPAARRTDIENAQRAFGTPTGAPSGGSDQLAPSAFTQPITEPDVDTVRALMFEYIAEGVRRGAFDDGNAAYADQWILAQLAGWLALNEESFRARLDSAAWIVGGRLSNLTVASGTLADLQERLAGLDRDLASWREVLLGHPEEVTAVSTGRGTAPLPAGLIEGGQLQGLALAQQPAPDPEAAPAASTPTSLPTIRAVDDTRESAISAAR